MNPFLSLLGGGERREKGTEIKSFMMDASIISVFSCQCRGRKDVHQT